MDNILEYGHLDGSIDEATVDGVWGVIWSFWPRVSRALMESVSVMQG